MTAPHVPPLQRFTSAKASPPRDRTQLPPPPESTVWRTAAAELVRYTPPSKSFRIHALSLNMAGHPKWLQRNRGPQTLELLSCSLGK
jgi:hypothetical protein